MKKRFFRSNFRLRSFMLIGAYLLLVQWVSAQNATQKITLHKNGAKLEQILKEIEGQTSYKVSYNLKLIDGIVCNVNFADATVDEVLKKVLKNHHLTYKVKKGTIIISSVGTKKQVNKVISGQVFEASTKQPLVGAAVRVLGSSTSGTATDISGRFSLTIPDGSTTLEVSFIGMKKRKIKIGKSVVFSILLEEDNSILDEVVVNGIFTRKVENFTGSASTFKGEELKAIGNQNILQSLSSLDPSIIIAENNLSGSNPNAAMSLSVNGTTSINGLTDLYGSDPNLPLFILDGFETSLQRISDLSMDRVESITTLKDASATAMYGAKAANGVIVVETIKPKAGKLKFSYTGNYQLAWADLSDYNLMNSSEKLQFEKLSGHYGSLDADGEIFDNYKRSLYYARYKDVVAGRNTYWMNEPLRTALTHEHSMAAHGGDSSFQYGLNLRYKMTEGVMKNSDRNNLDGTVNLLYRIDKFRFSNQTNINYVDVSNNTVSFSQFSRANPFYSKYNEAGEIDQILESKSSITGTEYITNPLWDFNQKSFNKSNIISFNNNISVEYHPIEKMRIQGKFGITTSRTKSEVFKSPFENSFINTETLKKGSNSQSNISATSYDGSFLINYGDVIGDHTYNFVAGSQLSERRSNSGAFSTIGYLSDKFPNPNFSNGYPEGGKPSSTVAKTRSASFYFNANYALKMKYLADFNLRSDGSSVFGVNNPFSTTWSFGLGWNIHNELFMKPLKNVVNYLKLRYSLGNPGNENFDAKISNSIYNYYTYYQNMFGLSAIVSKWGNNNLKWQRTLVSNIGLDAELFNSRLYLSADYTIKKTDPLLLYIDQPTSIGSSTVPMNIGATKNKSMSVALNYFILKKRGLSWQVNLSYLHTRTTYYNIGNLLDKYNEKGRSNQTLLRYYDGVSSTALWSVRSLGIDPSTGNECFVKKDGSYTYQWDSSDEVVCGDSTPDAEGNVGTNLRYKNFTFGSSFRYRFGGQTQLTTLLTKVENISDAKLSYNQDKRALSDRWKNPGDIAKFKRIDDTSITNMSSRFIADENTFQCTSITLGYEDTKSNWVKSLGLSSIYYRMYMNNIFRISTVKEERGLDYPFQRSISASLGLRF